MTNGKDIHSEFTKKLQKRGENFGFFYEQVEEGIKFYGFSPFDADFAAYIGDSNLIISEMTKEDLAKIREEYNKAVKDKESEFPFEEESEEEEEEIITSSERNGRGIRHDFTPDLVQGGQECGFSYEETSDGINIGMIITDAEFCAGLRDVKRVDAEGVLNHSNVEQLQNEHQQYCSLITQQVQIKY